MTDSKWVPMEAAARRLGRSRPSLYYMDELYKKTFVVGKRRFIREQDLTAYMLKIERAAGLVEEKND